MQSLKKILTDLKITLYETKMILSSIDKDKKSMGDKKTDDEPEKEKDNESKPKRS